MGKISKKKKSRSKSSKKKRKIFWNWKFCKFANFQQRGKIKNNNKNTTYKIMQNTNKIIQNTNKTKKKKNSLAK